MVKKVPPRGVRGGGVQEFLTTTGDRDHPTPSSETNLRSGALGNFAFDFFLNFKSKARKSVGARGTPGVADNSRAERIT
jgi:hypothetical protein